jgi:segregation and condensation protein B
MNDSYLKNLIEAALLAAGRPLEIADLAALFDEPLRPEKERIRAALEALAADYAERGIELKETASGFRVQVRRELAEEISRLWPERPARYSRALLETLALIAYRQPITRGEIEAVRGVAVNPNIVKTLLERNWVRVLGQRDVPGHPELLGTTREFLDYFGLKRLDELPPLAELRAMTELNVQLDLTPGREDERPPSGGEELLLPAPPDDALERAAEPDILGDEPDDDEGELSGDPESSAGMVAAPSDGGPGIG